MTEAISLIEMTNENFDEMEMFEVLTDEKSIFDVVLGVVENSNCDHC